MRRRSNTIRCQSIEEYIEIANNNMEHELAQQKRLQNINNQIWNFETDNQTYKYNKSTNIRQTNSYPQNRIELYQLSDQQVDEFDIHQTHDHLRLNKTMSNQVVDYEQIIRDLEFEHLLEQQEKRTQIIKFKVLVIGDNQQLYRQFIASLFGKKELMKEQNDQKHNIKHNSYQIGSSLDLIVKEERSESRKNIYQFWTVDLKVGVSQDIIAVYYTTIQNIFLIFSLNNSQSFIRVQNEYELIQKQHSASKQYHIFMIGVQSKTENTELDQQAQQYAQQHRMHYLKTNLNSSEFNKSQTLDLLFDQANLQ